MLENMSLLDERLRSPTVIARMAIPDGKVEPLLMTRIF